MEVDGCHRWAGAWGPCSPRGWLVRRVGICLHRKSACFLVGLLGKKSISEGGQSHPIRSVGSWLQLSQSPSPWADRVGLKGLGQLPETLSSCGLSFETLGLQGPEWMVTLVGRAQGARPRAGAKERRGWGQAWGCGPLQPAIPIS